MTYIFKYIVIRKEFKLNEFRVALVPSDCIKLINGGIIVYVEKSNNRCIKDSEYSIIGCKMIDNIYQLQNPKDEILIIGLKELDLDDNNIFSYKHMYFSHTYKNQAGCNNILEKFKLNNGIIYDMEYFTDDNNKRLFAFGNMAGFIGCYLGLLQYYNRNSKNMDLKNLLPYKSSDIIYNNSYIIANYIIQNNIVPQIAVIGINGHTGNGCIKLLKKLKLEYTGYTRDMSKNDLHKYNIIFNCINIIHYIIPFITLDTINNFNKMDVIVDISCDYNNKYNPLPIYNNCSTFANPIIKVNNIDIIAIENLPSLLPVESSNDFSNKLVDIINNLNYINSWDKVYKLNYK